MKAEKITTANDRIGKVLQSETLEKLRKHIKKDLFARASEHRSATIQRIPTGIFPLDYALHGGLAVGRVSLMYGHKAASKTSTFLRAIGNAQKMCANCWIPFNPLTGEVGCVCKDFREPVVAMINVEATWDEQWAKCLGVDTTKILYSEPEYGEQAVDIFEALLLSGDCDIILLDSIAFLVPVKETEESAEKDLMGQQPRLIGKLIRKTISALASVGANTGRRPTIFFTNQIRNKMTMFGNPETTPGGYAVGFATSAEVRMTVGKADMDEKLGRPKTIEVEFRIEKNKTGGTARMEASYKLVLCDGEIKKKGQVVDEPYIMDLAEQIGVIEKVKNKWSVFNQEFTARSLIERRLMTDPEFSLVMRTTLMERLLKLG